MRKERKTPVRKFEKRDGKKERKITKGGHSMFAGELIGSRTELKWRHSGNIEWFPFIRLLLDLLLE